MESASQLVTSAQQEFARVVDAEWALVRRATFGVAQPQQGVVLSEGSLAGLYLAAYHSPAGIPTR